MKNLIAISLLLVSSLAFANVDVKLKIKGIELREKTCLEADGGDSTVGMKMCLGTAGEELDALLNTQYRAIVADLKAKATDKYDQEFKVEAFSRLINSERAWVKFRDEDSFLSGISSYGGTLEGIDISSSFNEITKARILQLDQLLADQR